MTLGTLFCYSDLVSRPQFRSLFCGRFQCAPSEYEEKAFRKCLYAHARLLAPLIHRVSPDFFSLDFKFIEYLGNSVGLREATHDVLDFNDANRGNRNFWRTGLKIRASGRKATRLVYELLKEAQSTAAPGARGLTKP